MKLINGLLSLNQKRGRASELTLKTYENQIAYKDDIIANKDAEIAEKDAEIARLKALLASNTNTNKK